jgi:NAD(P)-dependent dehydrogenase (short-subunit alcohol dehydrogenase family)
MPRGRQVGSRGTGTSAVVTGAARGIGRGIAEHLVARGHRVVVADVDGEAAARTCAEIGAAAGVEQDVRRPESHEAVAELAARHGRLAAWFNNAGVGHDGRLTELDADAVRRLVDVNLLGVVWGTRAAIAAMGQRGGDVVNTASLSGLGPVPGLSLYAATKAAVVSLSMSVNAETPRRLRVHALCPDGVSTPLLDAMRPDGIGRQLVFSGGRILTVDETAAAAVALLGRRRVVRTLPGHRAAAMRAASLSPSLIGVPMRLVAAQGRWAQRRSAG